MAVFLCVRHNKRYTSLRVVFSTLSIRSQMCKVRLFLFLHRVRPIIPVVRFNNKTFSSFSSWLCGWLFVVNIFHINCQMQYTRIFLSYIMTYLPHIYTRTTCKTNFVTDLFISLCPLFHTSHTHTYTHNYIYLCTKIRL